MNLLRTLLIPFIFLLGAVWSLLCLPYGVFDHKWYIAKMIGKANAEACFRNREARKEVK